MSGFFKNDTLDNKYNELRHKVIANYSEHGRHIRLLLKKIEALKNLEREYPEKQSIRLAFDLLNDVAHKDFRDINDKITELQKAASEDIFKFDFVKACISLVFLPLMLPLLVLEIVNAIAFAYRFMMLAHIALLATAITLNILFLPPLMLLATIPAAIALSHLLSEFIVDRLVDKLIYDVGAVLGSLFYVQDKHLKAELDDIVEVATKAHNLVEGSAARRFFSDMYNQFGDCFGCEALEQEEPIPGFGR